MTIRTAILILAGTLGGLAVAQIISQETQEDRILGFARARTTAELAMRRDLEDMRTRQRDMSTAWEDMAERVQQAEMAADVASLRVAQARALMAQVTPRKPKACMVIRQVSSSGRKGTMVTSGPLIQAVQAKE